MWENNNNNNKHARFGGDNQRRQRALLRSTISQSPEATPQSQPLSDHWYFHFEQQKNESLADRLWFTRVSPKTVLNEDGDGSATISS
jgi:hypothetical protein